MTDWGVGKYMVSSGGRRRDVKAVVSPTSHTSPELQRLADAQATLDQARRNAKWKRECKNLQSASRAVQVAALAAHQAGFGWTEIGDVLGIARDAAAAHCRSRTGAHARHAARTGRRTRADPPP
ncbi:MAG: hypothetical protein M3O32_04485 [Actinomycetota bacterium]|nr:hypothetical protein [Actinomycetota bacterium]